MKTKSIYINLAGKSSRGCIEGGYSSSSTVKGMTFSTCKDSKEDGVLVLIAYPVY